MGCVGDSVVVSGDLGEGFFRRMLVERLGLLWWYGADKVPLVLALGGLADLGFVHLESVVVCCCRNTFPVLLLSDCTLF